MIDAVTFDFWNTVMFEGGGELKARRLEIWADLFGSAGIEVDASSLSRAHDIAFEAYVEAWERNEQFRVEDAARRIATAIDFAHRRRVEDVLVQGFSEAGRRAKIELCDGVSDVLHHLSRLGVRLAVVCDVGLTPSNVLRERLAAVDLLEVFDETVFSDEVGWYKPAPEIFAHTLDAIRADPSRSAHVGDRKRTDVQGARGCGMTSVRYTAVFDDPALLPEADYVVDHHRHLLEVLELA